MTNPFAKKAPSRPSPTQLKTEIRAAIADNHETESALAKKNPAAPTVTPVTESRVSGNAKLSQLIEDDFPFDESQLAAIAGMTQYPQACLTGAAGTGKTTVTKKLVDVLRNDLDLSMIDMNQYFKSSEEPEDPEDVYETESKEVLSIALVGFTGRSTQQIKKNFPSDWHGNIMTIHRLLGFVPEYYAAENDEGMIVNKRRFVPTYTADNLLPWDVIIMDESGMTGLDLWHQLYAAMKPDCRIYFVGDINQLPPVHGKSVFGFAMAKYPSWELTHIHRQVGVDNPIVDNAWRILRGQMPVSGGKFQMIELKGSPSQANQKVRGILGKLIDLKIYDPIRDSVITPINGHEGSRGYELGQLPLNQQLATQFNPTDSKQRYIIDGGRERKQFAVGDKVMATKNDHQAGITNGMTGLITKITEHQGYSGDRTRFGTVEEVNNYLRGIEDSDDSEAFTLEDLADDFESAQDSKEKDEKEAKVGRGPSSHMVTVEFGHGKYAKEITFATLSEVGSLMTAYVVTCHKMQGGEAPTIVIIAHHVHKQMLYREWLYTAVTRASERCILLYTPLALRTGLNKQNIKGATLQEKIASFSGLVDPNRLIPSTIKVALPGNHKPQKEIDRERAANRANHSSDDSTAITRQSGFGQLVAKAKQKSAQIESSNGTKPKADAVGPTERRDRVVIIERTIYKEKDSDSNQNSQVVPESVDGGDLKQTRPALAAPNYSESAKHMYSWWRKHYVEPAQVKLLTHTPPAKPKPVVVTRPNPFASLAAKPIFKAKTTDSVGKPANPWAKKVTK